MGPQITSEILQLRTPAIPGSYGLVCTQSSLWSQFLKKDSCYKYHKKATHSSHPHCTPCAHATRCTHAVMLLCTHPQANTPAIPKSGGRIHRSGGSCLWRTIYNHYYYHMTCLCKKLCTHPGLAAPPLPPLGPAPSAPLQGACSSKGHRTILIHGLGWDLVFIDEGNKT